MSAVFVLRLCIRRPAVPPHSARFGLASPAVPWSFPAFPFKCSIFGFDSLPSARLVSPCLCLPRRKSLLVRMGCLSLPTANLCTKILDFRWFDSSRILISRGGILGSIGDFPENLSQAVLVAIILAGSSGAFTILEGRPAVPPEALR